MLRSCERCFMFYPERPILVHSQFVGLPPFRIYLYVINIESLYKGLISWAIKYTSSMVDDLQSHRNATHNIIIPVANSNTIPVLIQVARHLLEDDRGRLILLFVVTGGDESASLNISDFRNAVEMYSQEEESISIQIEIYHSEDVVTGILDMVEHYSADMILLGFSYSIRGQVELGQIVESVAEQATCDVGVYRTTGHTKIDRVVVPVGGSIASSVILRIGIQLARSRGLPCESLYVYSHGEDEEAHRHVSDLLNMVPHETKVKINVVRGIDEANSVLSWANENDLLVIGFSERNPLQKWLYGDTAQRILDRATGPVLMVARAIDNAEIQALTKRRLSWLRPLLTESEQEHVVWLAKDTVLPTLDYFVLLIVAALIATFGLLLNSSAVVIGAMLVAPLMQPIIALGIALCTARLNLSRKAIVTILLSVMIVVAVGFIVGLLIPPASPTKEMLARAYPSLLDGAVALTAGFIGAYATARKDIPAALAGVAIAAALVPPICTVGLSLALSEPRLALGSALLFVTNLVAITVITAGVFFWMGMRPTRLDDRARRRRYALLLIGTICLLLSVGTMLNYTYQPSVERISETRLQAVLEPAELISLQIRQQEPLLVVATVRTSDDLTSETVKMARVMLSEDLESDVRLRIVIQRVIDSY